MIMGGSTVAWNMHASDRTLHRPLDRYDERPKLLTYGLYVTPDPAQNPIDPPERFTGYHTALDLEILPGEETADVPVYALCPGEVAYAGFAEGYGGVVVHRCVLEGNREVTVLYGHLDRASFGVKEGDTVAKGQRIGSLGAAHSADTDNTRKHLHLGIHAGRDLDYLGYATDQAELGEWIDPQPLLD